MKDKIMKWIKDPRNLVILVLVIICMILGYCGQRKKPCTTETVTKTVTIPGDSIPYEKIIYKPKPYKVIEKYPEYVYKYMDVDTQAIILSFFEEKSYDVVFRDDTSMYIRVKFNVWQNAADSIKVTALNRRPWSITYTNKVEQKDRDFKVYAGITVGGWTDKISLSLGLLIQYKSFVSGFEYDIIGKEARVPLYYKLSFGKKK